MAELIQCPTCKNNVSSNAATCPHCGEVINSRMTKPAGAINLKDPVHLAGVILAGLMVLGVIVAIIANIVADGDPDVLELDGHARTLPPPPPAAGD